MAPGEGMSIKNPKGRTKAEHHEALVAKLQEAMDASARAANAPGSIGDRGFAVDTAREILDESVPVAPAWDNS
eukprot:6461564-Heterocapsa_arctica.AAC.1